jgi:hypothetical protein
LGIVRKPRGSGGITTRVTRGYAIPGDGGHGPSSWVAQISCIPKVLNGPAPWLGTPQVACVDWMSGGSLVIGVPAVSTLPNQQLPGVCMSLTSPTSPFVGLAKNPLCVKLLFETVFAQSS